MLPQIGALTAIIDHNGSPKGFDRSRWQSRTVCTGNGRRRWRSVISSSTESALLASRSAGIVAMRSIRTTTGAFSCPVRVAPSWNVRHFLRINTVRPSRFQWSQLQLPQIIFHDFRTCNCDTLREERDILHRGLSESPYSRLSNQLHPVSEGLLDKGLYR